jgi:heme-degrading monooxygenase HmoA
MIASILRIPAGSERDDELFARFLSTPGLVHAYLLRPVDESEDSLTVSIWENAAARTAYMEKSQLAGEVNARFGTARSVYAVENSK